MKKIAIIATIAVLAFALAGCQQESQKKETSSAPASTAMNAVDPASSAPVETSAAPEQKETTIEWVKVNSADEAAKGAGIEKFGVLETLTVDDKEFKDPSFAYAGGVAQAMYENGAVGLIVRKAGNDRKAPLSDRDKTEFPNKWTETYAGLDVTLYGPEKGSAVIFTWTDGTQDYGVTYQGLGGEEVTLAADDVEALVTALKNANVVTQQQQQQTQENHMEISQTEAMASAEGVSGGKTISAYQNYVDGHGWVWVITTKDENGNVNSYYVDNYGNPYNVEGDSNSSTELTLPEAEARAIVEGLSGGTTTTAYVVRTENHGLCWFITTADENGNVNSYHVDNTGNAFNVEFE